MSRVTVSMADVILSGRCWIFLIFSAYTMFLIYPHRKKKSGERSGLRGGQGIGPPLPIQASGNLSFKKSVTNQLKCSKVIPFPARARLTTGVTIALASQGHPLAVPVSMTSAYFV